MNSDPPTTTTPSAATHAISTNGFDSNDPTMVAVRSRHSSDISVGGLRSDHQGDEKDPAEERRGDEQLEQRIGDRLDDRQRPVGGRDERAALQRELERRGERHGGPFNGTSPQPKSPIYNDVVRLSPADASVPPLPWRTLARIAAGGLICALLVLAGGWGVRRAVFGRDDSQARARVEADVRSTFDAMSRQLRDMAAALADPALVRAAADDDTPAAHRLLTRAAEVVASDDPARCRVDGVRRRRNTARVGRPSIGAPRRSSSGARGLVPGCRSRRACASSTCSRSTSDGARVGTIAVERPLPSIGESAAGRAALQGPARTRFASRRRSPQCRYSCPSKARHRPATPRPSTCQRRRRATADGERRRRRSGGDTRAVASGHVVGAARDSRDHAARAHRAGARLAEPSASTASVCASPCCSSWRASWPPDSRFSRRHPPTGRTRPCSLGAVRVGPARIAAHLALRLRAHRRRHRRHRRAAAVRRRSLARVCVASPSIGLRRQAGRDLCGEPAAGRRDRRRRAARPRGAAQGHGLEHDARPAAAVLESVEHRPNRVADGPHPRPRGRARTVRARASHGSSRLARSAATDPASPA